MPRALNALPGVCCALLVSFTAAVATSPVSADSPPVSADSPPVSADSPHHVVFDEAGFHLVFAPAPDDSSRLRLFRWMVEDISALPAAVWSPRFALSSAGLVGGTFATAWLDDDISEQVVELYTGGFRDVLDVVDYVGGPKINLPVVAMAGASMLTSNIKLQDAAFTSLQTLVYAGVLGYALKGVFGRARPEWTEPYDPYAFFDRTGMNPLSHEGNSSYPSGHAIASFGIITPWVLYYPSVFTYALYAIPTGTAISRLAIDKHWATDLVVGAVIGISMGSWLTCRHLRPAASSERFRLSVMDDGKLFSLLWSLN